MTTETAAMSVDIDDLALADTDFFGLPRRGRNRDRRTAIRSQVRRLTEFLDRHGARCTWFVPGYILEACPDVLEDACDRGHEFACHGHLHIPAYRHTPSSFEDDLGTAVGLLRRATGAVPIGYRAPGFTLLPVAGWATPILQRQGFRYSSSVPALAVGQHRYRMAGPRPFRWPCGLTELPISTQRVWGVRVPICGSVYTRLLPHALIKYATAKYRRESAHPLFYYCHPFEAFPEAAPCPVVRRNWGSRLYAAGRGDFLGKLEWILTQFTCVPYAAVAAKIDHDDATCAVVPTNLPRSAGHGEAPGRTDGPA